ncbi:Putative lumazine-binding protein [Elizabethkingia miricola]|nr:Putative lumazine-binding protein [Elizabethkingia miricola]
MKRTILILNVLLINAVFMTTQVLSAQNVTYYENISLKDVQNYVDEFQKNIQIPGDYKFRSVMRVNADEVPAYLFRYEKDNRGFGQEHFSFIISESKKQILGFTNMDKKYADLKMLSKKETEKIAKEFLLKLDKSLTDNLKNIWIERHDEEVIINGNNTILAGMKYKCYNASENNYAWVIVGSDGSIISFERNIKWNNKEHKRITEKWLHDSWIKEHVNFALFSEEQKLKLVTEESFLNGILNELNIENIDKGFHSDFAILIADGAKLKRLELPVWKNVVKSYKNDPEKMKSRDRKVDYKFQLLDITGNAAIVKIELIRNGNIITTDYISYLKFNNEWKAVSKVSNEHIPNPFNL